MIDSGIIGDSMLPKVDACIKALDGGVKKAHIIDGRIEHSLLLEIYTDKGVGTQIFKGDNQ
jgi:acetylglutamate kinase